MPEEALKGGVGGKGAAAVVEGACTSAGRVETSIISGGCDSKQEDFASSPRDAARLVLAAKSI